MASAALRCAVHRRFAISPTPQRRTSPGPAGPTPLPALHPEPREKATPRGPHPSPSPCTAALCRFHLRRTRCSPSPPPSPRFSINISRTLAPLLLLLRLDSPHSSLVLLLLVARLEARHLRREGSARECVRAGGGGARTGGWRRSRCPARGSGSCGRGAAAAAGVARRRDPAGWTCRRCSSGGRTPSHVRLPRSLALSSNTGRSLSLSLSPYF